MPIYRAFYIDHFSVYLILFSFGKKGKNINLVKIPKKKKKITSRSILVYQRFNYWLLSVTALVTIDEISFARNFKRFFNISY